MKKQVTPNKLKSAEKAIKRPRGRPRKYPRITDRLGEFPSFVALARATGKGNILEKAKIMLEYNRRYNVGEAVRKAYSDGRNTANKIRHNEKLRRENRLMEESGSLIFSTRLSVNAVVSRLIESGKNHGLGRTALWHAINNLRNSPGAK